MSALVPAGARALSLARLPWPAAGSVLRTLAHPSRLLLGVAGTAVVANAVALAAPADPARPANDGGRMGAAVREAVDARDRAAAKERQQLDLRERALKASEARLAGQAQGTGQRAPASSGASPAVAADTEVPYDRLAGIYQRMKASNAAPIFERLDLEVQTQIARRMRDQVTAQIMAKMSPDAAVKLSMSLAGRRVVEVAARGDSGKKRPRPD